MILRLQGTTVINKCRLFTCYYYAATSGVERGNCLTAPNNKVKQFRMGSKEKCCSQMKL